jgi:hypothetical protein
VAFTPFKPLYQGKPVASAGSFVGRQDANYIAVVTEGDVDRMRIVFHEYAHLVISNVLRHVPAWLSEGLAEFYSTYELRGGREAVLGRVIPYHLQRLQETRLLKLDELLSVDRQFPLYNEKDRRFPGVPKSGPCSPPATRTNVTGTFTRRSAPSMATDCSNGTVSSESPCNRRTGGAVDDT